MWIIVGQRPVVLSIGAGRVVLIFFSSIPFPPLCGRQFDEKMA